jgi:hypothetical protein
MLDLCIKFTPCLTINGKAGNENTLKRVNPYSMFQHASINQPDALTSGVGIITALFFTYHRLARKTLFTIIF